MAVRHAKAIWEGNLREGCGTMKVGSGAFEVPFSFATRFEDKPGTNPEELIGAAHAGCFSMALGAGLGNAGYKPKRILTRAEVTFGQIDGKPRITQIHLDSTAEVPGITKEAFDKIAEETKTGCPISAALASVKITLAAHLVS